MQATGPVASQCKWLDTRLGPDTVPETGESQIDNRGYSTEMIYSSSNEDYDSRDERTQQAGTEKG